MLALDLTIRTYGWQLTQITDTNPWSYTIGLTESYDHPEPGRAAERLVLRLPPALDAALRAA